jgi:hypothetical protein
MKSRQSIVIEQLQKAQNIHDLEALLACFAPNFQGNYPRHPEWGVQVWDVWSDHSWHPSGSNRVGTLVYGTCISV